MPIKKQVKITKIFRKGLTKKQPPRRISQDEKDELIEEIKQLEKTLRDKNYELFNLQRNSYRQKLTPPKEKRDTFVRPKKIIINNNIDSSKRNLQLISMLSGVEVQSYVANDHCCIVYHMQHNTEHEVKHGIKVDMTSGTNFVTKYSLPVGFNFKAVIEDYDNVMNPECLSAIRKGLVAYYERLEQFKALKKLVNIEAQLFKTLDGSHMEITFHVKNETDDEEEPFNVTLMLEYRVYDIRPKTFVFKGSELPEDISDILRQQCVVFKKKPLRKAFKEAFLDGIGQYKLVEQVGLRPADHHTNKRPRLQPTKQNYNNDDTFRPEECSDYTDDEH